MAAATLAACALVGGTAEAATVTSELKTFTDRAGAYQTLFVRFTAAPGEANRLTVGFEADFGLRLHDPAGITPSTPCVAHDPTTTICPPLGGIDLTAVLGDGDDTLIGVPMRELVPKVTADGGDGNDTLSVKRGRLSGGAGDDHLIGDTVDGGPGADVLQGRMLTYASESQGVEIDLAAGRAGPDQLLPGTEWVVGSAGADVIRAGSTGVVVDAGAGDDIVDGSPRYDSLDGGPGADTLRGQGGNDDLLDNDGPERNRLEGGPGNDYLLGGRGADTLDGGPGRDRMRGEAGADVLLADDGRRDTVECTANDGPLEGDRATLDAHDADAWCDHVTRSGRPRLQLHALLREGQRGLRLVVSCPRAARTACTGRARVHGFGGRRRVNAALRVRVPPGRRAQVPVRLDRPVRTRGYEFNVEVVIRGRTLTLILGAARR